MVIADHVSGGRIDLGIGAGWHEREHEAYGFPFAPTKTRIDVLEEQLQVLMGTWGDGPFSFDGRALRPVATSTPSPSPSSGRIPI